MWEEGNFWGFSKKKKTKKQGRDGWESRHKRLLTGQVDQQLQQAAVDLAVRKSRRHPDQALGWQHCIPRVYIPIARNSKKAFQFLDMERVQADGFFRQPLLEILEGQISTGTAFVRGDAKPRQRKNWNVFIQIFIRQMTWEIHLAGGLIACIFPIRVSLPCDQTRTTSNFYFLDHTPGNWDSRLFIFLMSRLASSKTWLQSSSG